MDIQVTNKVIGTTESLFDDFDERPVDCDFVLPDYLPDIAAVLKCTMKPVVQSKQLSGDRLIADGVANLRVLYLDEARKCVRSCEFTQPFTSTFNVKNAGVGACIRLDAKPNYVNCRATSPRRLDIHGAFSVKLKVTAEGGQEVVSSARGEGVYTRTKPLYYTVPASSAEKPFTISEVLELGPGKLPAETLIRSEAVANVKDCKMMPGKVILKGEVLLCTLYANDTVAGTMDRVEHEIPFSQIVDVDGLDEEWFCDCRADVTVCDVHITQNPNGENVLLSVSIKLQAQVQCYRTGASEIITDAYLTSCPLKLDTRRVETQQLLGIRKDVCPVKETLELPPEGVAGIVDMWCEAAPVATRCEEKGSAVDGRLLVSMLAKDAAGMISYYERPVDFTLDFSDKCSSMTAELEVLGVEFSLNSQQMDVRVQVGASRHCMMTDSCVAVTGMTADESAPFAKSEAEQRCALKIYFAGGGESLWEIAKSCHTSMEAVMEENGLAADVLPEDTMLLVPLC